ncbi:hypothetical protein BDZ89DRAFT_1048228 [Hymenopellis radicata]|nr:hypothetical protein BDZ89DRAFT_1048228 [Hymenopellis radicata]
MFKPKRRFFLLDRSTSERTTLDNATPLPPPHFCWIGRGFNGTKSPDSSAKAAHGLAPNTLGSANTLHEAVLESSSLFELKQCHSTSTATLLPHRSGCNRTTSPDSGAKTAHGLVAKHPVPPRSWSSHQPLESPQRRDWRLCRAKSIPLELNTLLCAFVHGRTSITRSPAANNTDGIKTSKPKQHFLLAHAILYSPTSEHTQPIYTHRHIPERMQRDDVARLQPHGLATNTLGSGSLHSSAQYPHPGGAAMCVDEFALPGQVSNTGVVLPDRTAQLSRQPVYAVATV